MFCAAARTFASHRDALTPYRRVCSPASAPLRSAAELGIDAYLVDVETDIANGLPTFVTVGLPQGAVKEGRERVYAALANIAQTWPVDMQGTVDNLLGTIEDNDSNDQLYGLTGVDWFFTSAARQAKDVKPGDELFIV